MSKKARKKLKVDILDRVSKESVSVGYKDVITAVQKVFPATIQLQFLDAEFTALPLQVWQKIIKFTNVNNVKYISSKRDCDNFAIGFAGQCSLRFGVNGAGIVVDISGKHAYNCILVKELGEDLVVKVLEPQTDGFVELGSSLSGQEAYVGTKGFILFA